MANEVVFEDFTLKVEAALNEAAIAFLHEAGGELDAEVKRNMDSLPGQWFAQQKNSWEYKVDESKGEAIVGNPLESALWTEFGTGEYALNKDGRKGYWVYVKGSSDSDSSISSGHQYTKDEARRIVAMMRKDGLDAHYTKGQTPKRPLFKAFSTKKAALIKRAESIFSNKLGG